MSIKKLVKQAFKDLLFDLREEIDDLEQDAYLLGFDSGYEKRIADEQIEAAKTEAERREQHEAALAKAYSKGYDDGWEQCNDQQCG